MAYPQNVDVFQDGADFYITEAHDESGGTDWVVTAPFKVTDFDMDAATKARTWFVETYCPANNLNPTF